MLLIFVSFRFPQQLLALGTNYFFGGLGVYDQHRDMRLEIDNMSYEVCNF